MKGIASLLLIFLLLAILVCLSVWDRELPESDFTYAIADSIKTLDPGKISWTEDIRIALGLWEGLMGLNPQTAEPVPGAAIELPVISGDGLTYTFELRSDARWSNGEPVTAGDFVYAWRRAIEPGTAGEYAFFITDNIAGAAEYHNWRNNAVRVLGILGNLAKVKKITDEDERFIQSQNLPGGNDPAIGWAESARRFRNEHLRQMESEFARLGLEALDDHHLRITLAQPIGYFLDLTAFATFMPIHKNSIEKLRITDDPAVADLTIWSFDPQWVKPDYHKNGYPGLVTNGPFTLADWQFKRYMLFKKNPFYWDRENVKSKSIMARIITEPSTMFLAYERGDLDWFNNLQPLDFAPALVRQMRNGERLDIHITDAFGTYFYCFNCNSHLADGSKNPFADYRVRCAFNLAVDKQAIVDQVRKIGNTVARNFIPPNSIEGYSCPPGAKYNPVKARELLAEAGCAGGAELPTIEILYNTAAEHRKTAEAIARMWEKNLGVRVLLKGKELKSFDEDKQNQRYMVCRASWYGDYADPTTFLDMMVTGNGQNDTGFSHPPYDSLMRQAAQCSNPQNRMNLLAQAEDMLINEQMPILPIYYYVNLMAYRNQVKGIYSNPRDMHPFKYIFVERQ